MTSAAARDHSDLPAVSVILPSYNVERFIGEAIQSVLDQTLSNFELLIRDDGSSDGTVGEVEKMRDRRIRFLPERTHVGSSSARNAMLALARAPLLCVMDSDDIMEPTLLEKKVAYLNAHPEISVAASLWQEIDEKGRFLPMSVWVRDYDPDSVQMKLLYSSAYLDGSTVFRTEALRHVGGWRPGLIIHDYDLHTRLAEGYDAVVLTEPLYRYRQWSRQTIVTHPDSDRRRETEATHRAMIQRRLSGSDSLDPSAPETGALHMETRTSEAAARLYGLWSRGFLRKPWHDARLARAFSRRAVRLAPLRAEPWAAVRHALSMSFQARVGLPRAWEREDAAADDKTRRLPEDPMTAVGRRFRAGRRSELIARLLPALIRRPFSAGGWLLACGLVLPRGASGPWLRKMAEKTFIPGLSRSWKWRDKMPASPLNANIVAIVGASGASGDDERIACVRRQTLAPARVELLASGALLSETCRRSGELAARHEFAAIVEADATLDSDCFDQLARHVLADAGAFCAAAPIRGGTAQVRIFQLEMLKNLPFEDGPDCETKLFAQAERRGWVHLTMGECLGERRPGGAS